MPSNKNTDPFAQMTEQFTAMFSQFNPQQFTQAPNFDLAPFVATTRKNIEAATQIMQSCAQCCQDLMQFTMQTTQACAQCCTETTQACFSNSSPQEKAAKQADAMQSAMKKAQACSDKATKLIEKTTSQNSTTLNKCVNDSFNDFKSAMKKAA